MNDDAKNERPAAAESTSRDAFDSALSRAFAEVPLPPGLLERLTATLAQEIDAEAVVPASSLAANIPFAAEDNFLPSPTRRRWLAAVGGTLAASIAGGLWYWQKQLSRSEIAFEELLDEVLDYAHAHPVANVTLHRTATEPPPVDLDAVRQALVLPGDLAWWRLEDRVAGRLGIGLELAQADEPRAVLFLLDRPNGNPSLPQLTGEPMRHPATTGGCAVGAWRGDRYAAVLVVEGDEARYLRFLQAPRVFA